MSSPCLITPPLGPHTDNLLRRITEAVQHETFAALDRPGEPDAAPVRAHETSVSPAGSNNGADAMSASKGIADVPVPPHEGGQGAAVTLGTIRAQRVCSLRNLTLSRSCLSLVLKGEKRFLKPGGTATLAVPGNMVFFPAGITVACTNTPEPDGDYLALTLSFGEDLADRVRRLLPPDAPLSRGERPPGYEEASSQVLRALQTFLSLLPDDGDRTLALMQQEQILYMLWKCGAEVFAAPPPLIGSIRRLVEEAPLKPWSPGLIATNLHMTERTLRRRLESLGTNASELVRLGRLHYGLGLLQSRHAQVGEVARLCGYTSQSRFAERFKEVFGLTPGAILLSRRPARHSSR